eukprot:CAMPEP_0174886194 /NCGR_PEP_ID=MMETSP0167-20121228/1454_1 /TAXON_ID=38298 /ORGANISM="Rhodella maculata, Strain CCMP736" /LENGTH=194 /DNA_ID=CAMNT_0016122093 /DNA_START=5 /DNA_END=589 /DNA_ORIENTATION=+
MDLDYELSFDECLDRELSSPYPCDDDQLTLDLNELTLLPAELVERATASFAELDANGDGFITYHEMEQLFGKLGIEPGKDKDLQEFLETTGLDPASGAGILDLHEFFAFLRALKAIKSEEDEGTRVRKAFNAWDSDGNGVLDREEFLLAMSMIGTKRTEAEIHELFDTIDADGNGSIEFDEFVDAVLKKGKEKI